MLAGLIPALVLATAQPTGSAAPSAQSGLTSGLHAQGATTTLDLSIGESVVLTFDRAFKPVLQSRRAAAAAATAARLPAPIDLQTPETKTGITVLDEGGDPRRLNEAAPGTVIMTLVSYKSGTLLLVENGLDVPIRYHAATMQRSADGGARGGSTTLCPAKPGIGTVETWAARFTSLLVVKFEQAAMGDDLCRM